MVDMLGIQTEELSYFSTDKTDTVKATLWFNPVSPPKAVLQITHGMNEYIGRYREFAEYLAENGFAVCGNDHLGHGRTAPSDEKLGYFAPRDGHRYLVEDVHELYLLMRERYPDLPYFLFGHSMGSFITRSYITKYGGELSGYICSGTGGPNPLGKIAVVLAEAEIRRLGEFGRSTFLSNLAFGGYNKRYTEHRTRYDWLTRDTEIVDRYEKDRLCNYVFTASGFRDLFLLLNEISTKAWAKKVPQQLPVHMISGKEDPVGEYGKGVRKVYDLLREAGVENLSLKLYDGCRHEVLNELNRKDTYAELLEWMNARIETAAGRTV